MQRAVRRDPQVLGAHADEHVAALEQPGRHMFIGGVPMNWATNTVSGLAYTSCGVPICCELTAVHHRDARAHGHRLDLIVGDVDECRVEPTVQIDQLGAGLAAQLGVEVRQRLVHAEHGRLAHDGAGQRDTLTLAAAELTRLAVEVSR